MNIGVVNIGIVNIGIVNTGVVNIGVVNIGVVNIGIVNIDIMNIGVVNIGVVNIGIVNIGIVNIGIVNISKLKKKQLPTCNVNSLLTIIHKYCRHITRTVLTLTVVERGEGGPLHVHGQKPIISSYKHNGLRSSCVLRLRVCAVIFCCYI